MKHIPFKKIVHIICLSPFVLVLATVLVVNTDLFNGSVTGKYFWFYGTMALASLSACIAVILYKKPFRFSLLDGITAAFACSVYVSALVWNDASQNTTKLALFTLLVTLYVGFRLVLHVFDRHTTLVVFVVCIVLTGLAEAVWGLRQLYGYTPSQHNLYKITGSFFNPGPYSGFLAVVFPFALYVLLHGAPVAVKNRQAVLRGTAAVTCIAILLVLPAAMSRAAWLGMIAGSVVVLYGYYAPRFSLKKYCLRHKKRMWIVGSAAVLFFAVACAGMYLLKKDSADGRLLIWKVSLKAAAEHPLGVGLGNFGNAYGNAQAAYMVSGSVSETEKYVADSPEYAFNEYLQIAVESGVASLLLFAVLLAAAYIRIVRAKNWAIAGALTALLVFAFFSYPFSVLPYLILFVFLLASHAHRQPPPEQALPCVVSRLPVVFLSVVCVALSIVCLRRQYPSYEAYKRWNANLFHSQGMIDKVLESYESFYPSLNDQTHYLFEYAQSLSKMEQYGKSNDILQRAVQLSGDPMLYNMMGKNHQALKEYAQAEACFVKAGQVVPNRLYPWYLLAKLYNEMGLHDKACEMATIVQTKEPKVHSTAVNEMREEVKRLCEK
ncbi:MAG: O-antigen ligase family protein [Prevotellaceae bacterium]|jgi:tetratricopeptide (TPR) repeat protein|nr:O-antigen ligase family protein [Prevotellaceae bacterium]